MNETDGQAWLKQHPDIDHLRIAVCDLNGSLRGKRLPAAQIGKVMDSGVRMSQSVLAFDIWGEDRTDIWLIDDNGDADGICEPTGRGPLPLPWAPRPTALVPVWLRLTDGSANPMDPRRALAAVAARYAAKGLTPVVASEFEFYLVEAGEACPRPARLPLTGRRMDDVDALSLREIEEFDAFLDAVYAACEALNIPADSATAEHGPGQMEINLLHQPDPMKAADDALLFKQLIKGVARQHGMAATFMAKPYGRRYGSSMHVHFSLLDAQGRNVFDDGGPGGTATLRHAVAGLLKAMPASMLTFAPHYNSYRRLNGESLAPNKTAWGYDNRTTPLRIPDGPSAARRIEHRVAGADANPYLVLTAILGSALTGIEAGAEPPPPSEGSVYEEALPWLPSDWGTAIDLFGEDPSLEGLFTPELRALFSHVKEGEAEIFAQEISAFEYRAYLTTV